MHILTKKWWALAATVPVAALIACSSGGPVEVILPSGEVVSEEEYEELVEEGKIDEMGNLVVEDEDDDAAGTDTKKSSSSKAGTSSGSTDSKTSASSTDSDDSGDATSSASKDESSSAGSEGTSSEGGSGDTAKSSSSVSGDATSSSSTVRQATLVDGSNFSVGTDDMKEVASGTQSELDSLKEILDNGGNVEGFEEVPTEFDENTLTYESFDEGDYYCFTGEGEWMHVTRELLGQYIPHYKNGQAWGNLRHFDVKFMDACEGVYFRRKS